ncbi:MAG: HAMP domain-containing histidine kinase [Erysipelotrichaceae bacterium]|nr:HAMP domain-containing histidine kinase [Erysipelotrichaceae bacterium]
MKKIFRHLSNMSLIQQLSAIIILFVGIFIVFFTIYLRGNIDDFVTNQCMNIIQRSQQTVIDNVVSGKQGYSELTYDSDVMHFVFSRGKLQSYYGTATYSEQFLADITRMVEAHGSGWIESNVHIEDKMYYYRLYTIDSHTQVISLMDENYGKAIASTLLSSVSNNTALMFSLMFILLLIWVGTVITPLHQIQSYVEKVRKGDEQAVLSVERGDEIGEMAKALVDMKEEIENQEKTKEEMIHNISHDLKTPIAIIKSYAESIRDGIYPYDTLEGSVDVIIENADRLSKKVQSLLFLNRLDYVMDQERDTDKTTEMIPLVNSVCQSFKMIRPEVKVEKYLQKGVVFKGDEESWRIVLSNLLDNALRYAENEVVIDVHDDMLTVFDDGQPISEEQQKRLFKPFERGDKGKFGLGLSICYKVCNTYGYKIEQENMPNGVIFIISPKEPAEVKKDKKSTKGKKPAA